MGARRSLAYKVLPFLPADLFCRMGSSQMWSMEINNRFFQNIVRYHRFGDWFSQLGQSLPFWCMSSYYLIYWALVLTCLHLLSPEIRLPDHNFGIWGGAVDCAPADLQPEMIHLYKECVLQRVPVIVYICKCLGVNCGSFRAGWPCAAPCSSQHAENKIQAWGFPLLQRICSWNSGWISVTAICCGLSFSAGRNKGKWWMLVPWSGLQEKWDKKRKTSNSSCILESHRLMSCQNVTASTHTSKWKVKSCQNLIFCKLSGFHLLPPQTLQWEHSRNAQVKLLVW